MSERKTLRAHLELGDLKADFQGDADELLKSIVKFLTQVYPSFETVHKIFYSPDVIKLAENLAGLVEVTTEGPLITRIDLPAKDAICLSLLGAYVGKNLGKIIKETLSPIELARITGKKRKTISNEIPNLLSEGLVERVPEGEYRLTILGIRRTESLIDEIRKKQESRSSNP